MPQWGTVQPNRSGSAAEASFIRQALLENWQGVERDEPILTPLHVACWAAGAEEKEIQVIYMCLWTFIIQ